MAKKISDAVIERLKKISPNELVAHGVIKTAPNFIESKQHGYCCVLPSCNSGEGHNHTGAATFDSDNMYYCHSCGNADEHGHKISTIDVYKHARGLQGENFNTIVRKMANEFGEYVDEGEDEQPRRRRTNHKIDATPDKKDDPAVVSLIKADLATGEQGLIDFVKYECKGLWRGLPIGLLLKFGCRYIWDWIHPNVRVIPNAYDWAVKTPRVIIPAGDSGYLARLVFKKLEDFTERERKYISEKDHAGTKALFNPDALNSDEPVICVEGYIDALSVIYAGFNAVALGGRGNHDLIVDALKRRIAAKKKMPSVIIMMDADAAGRKAAPILHERLRDIGCASVIKFLFDETIKKDFNDVLIDEGVTSLRGRLQSIVDASRDELNADAAQINNQAEKKEISAVDKVADVGEENLIDALFRGDATDDDFADRMKLFCGGEIHWQKDIKSWLIFERNGQGGAVWTDAGEQNSCLLPFARKMTDLMTANAKGDQRELAKKFKSTKKRLQSITALKGIDDILITSDDLNRHAEFLNVRNGVIDLTSGKLMMASPELLLTQQAAAVFNPKCDDKTFANFFKSVLPDEESRAVILRFLGYCLTADVSAEKYLLIYGRGGNGKGALLLTLRTLLKDFAVELPVDTVLENKSKLADANGRATTEISPLAMCRLGIVDELPRGGRLDVAKVNRLTGGDFIPMRLLRREYKDVAPTHKLIMTGNYRPRIDDTRDAALLRRLLVVNFAQDFTQNPDVALKKKLVADAALTGALNLLVPAAVEFFKHGLLEPSPLMKHAREDFLGENDFVGEYISEFYLFDETLSTKRKDLLAHMKKKCAECERYTDADLTTMISKVDGVTYTKDRHNANVFKGIGLAPPKDEQAQSQNGYDTGFTSSQDYRYKAADDIENPPFD